MLHSDLSSVEEEVVLSDGVVEVEEGLYLVELLPGGAYQLVPVSDEYLK